MLPSSRHVAMAALLYACGPAYVTYQGSAAALRATSGGSLLAEIDRGLPLMCRKPQVSAKYFTCNGNRFEFVEIASAEVVLDRWAGDFMRDALVGRQWSLRLTFNGAKGFSGSRQVAVALVKDEEQIKRLADAITAYAGQAHSS